FIEKLGFFVVDHEPMMEERRAHVRIAKVIYEGGYRASRTPMDLPMSKAIVEVVRASAGKNTVVMPSSGGSIPMYSFEDLGRRWRKPIMMPSSVSAVIVSSRGSDLRSTISEW